MFRDTSELFHLENEMEEFEKMKETLNVMNQQLNKKYEVSKELDEGTDVESHEVLGQCTNEVSNTSLNNVTNTSSNEVLNDVLPKMLNNASQESKRQRIN